MLKYIKLKLALVGSMYRNSCYQGTHCVPCYFF
nr:MAG TPA: hypothetical protein [Caudoviricetes sp.]